jgi:hypothetical protein
MRLNVKALGLTCAILWGLGIFVLTWWIIAFEGTSTQPNLLSQGYRGYTMTPIGSIIGLVWGFFDGLVGGVLFAWFYNKLACRE